MPYFPFDTERPWAFSPGSTLIFLLEQFLGEISSSSSDHNTLRKKMAYLYRSTRHLNKKNERQHGEESWRSKPTLRGKARGSQLADAVRHTAKRAKMLEALSEKRKHGNRPSSRTPRFKRQSRSPRNIKHVYSSWCLFVTTTGLRTSSLLLSILLESRTMSSMTGLGTGGGIPPVCG